MEKEFSAEEMERLKRAIAAGLGIDASGITPETRFAEDLLADSFDMAMVLTEVDEAFDTAIPSEDTEYIHTVRDLMEDIRSYPASEWKPRPVRWSSGSTQ